MELKELMTIHDLVKAILEKNKQARNDVNLLYYYVCRHIGKQQGINVDNMSLPNFLLNMKSNHLPPMESVSRAKRKVVEQHPELAGDAKVEEARRDNEYTYREYAAKG